MTRAWPLILLVILLPAFAHSDSSDLEGGVFIAHHPPGLQFTSGQDWCARYFQEFAIDSCSEQNNRIDLDGNEGAGSVWFVLAAWDEEKEWCGAEFGFAEYDSTIYAFFYSGACFPDGPSGGLEIPTAGWPGPNAGVSLSISGTPWSGNFAPIYWFGGYAYYQGEIPLAVNPSSEFGGAANCEMPPQARAATSFGAMGIFEDGVSACPEGLVDGGGLDGGTQPDGYGGYEPEEDDEGFGEPEWIDLGGDPNNPLDIHLVESDGSTSVLELTIGGFYRTPVWINDSTYYHISLADVPVSADSCLPALPHIPRSLIIPDNQRMVFSIDSTSFVDLDSTPVAPSKGAFPMTVDPDTMAFCFDSVYALNDLYPAAAVYLGRPYILRDYRGIVVDFRPFQARPASDSLRVYTHMIVEIFPAGADTVNVFAQRGPVASIDRAFDVLYQDHFLNYGNLGTLSGRPLCEDQGLLIIAGSEFAGAVLDSLVQWKLQEGIPAQLRIVTDNENRHDPIYIWNIICDAYYGPQHVSHVLLVGDEPQMPTFLYKDSWNGVHRPADPRYTFMNGLDSYPDVFVGRFTAWELSELGTQVERTIIYERDVDVSADWLGLAAGIATDAVYGPDWVPDPPPGHTQTGVELMEQVRDSLLSYSYTSVDQIYNPADWIDNIYEALNAGRGACHYFGHGAWNSWAFDLDHGHFYVTDDLQNHGMLPFIMSCACQNGYFSYPEPYEPADPDLVCFAEQWLRAIGPSGEPRGAVAALMSSVSQFGFVTAVAMRHAAGLLKAEQLASIGALWYGAECYMLDYWTGTDLQDDAERFLSTWTLFGDPSLAVRTRAPDGVRVEHAGTFLPGEQESFDLTVRKVDETPLPGARCAFYGGGVLYGCAVTDENGSAVIPLDPVPTVTADMTLTITARNRVTYVGTVHPGITVAPDGSMPFGTIQEAIDACSDGWTVLLKDGVFHGYGNRDIYCGGLSVTLMSESGNPADCIIDCEGGPGNPHTGVMVDQGNLVLRGVTVTGAWYEPEQLGSAVYCDGGDLTATDCVFSKNHALYGGGVYFHGQHLVLSRCGFFDNAATADGGGVCFLDGYPAAISECTFAADSAYQGGALSIRFSLDLANCTLHKNYAAEGGGIYYGYVEETTFRNTIVDSSQCGGAVYCGRNEPPTLTCCDLVGNLGGDWSGEIASQAGTNGNFSADPVFCKPDSPDRDFRLFAGSPCLPGHHPVGAESCYLIGAWPLGCPPSGIEDQPLRVDDGLRPRMGTGNPFLPPGEISYEVPAGMGASRVRLTVYDSTGRLVRTLVDELQSPGVHHVTWDGRDVRGMRVPAAVYFLRLGAARSAWIGRAAMLK